MAVVKVFKVGKCSILEPASFSSVFIFGMFVRIVSEFVPPPEVQLKRKPGVLQRNDGTKPNVKDTGRGRGRGISAESNVDESQFVHMKSVFSEGPMMAQTHVNNSRLYSGKI